MRCPVCTGSRFQLALAMLRELRRPARPGRRASQRRSLACAATDPLQIEPMLDILVALDWVGRLDEAGEATPRAARDPARTPAEPLIAALLLDPAPDLGAFWKEAGFDRLQLADLLRE